MDTPRVNQAAAQHRSVGSQSWFFSERRLVAAFHEAGHAVAAYLFGIDIRYAMIDNHGRGQVSWLPGSMDREDAVVALAGPWAEHGYTGERAEFSAADRAIVSRYLGHSTRRDPSLHDLHDAARRIVVSRWNLVDCAAHELADAGEISGAELSGLLIGARMKAYRARIPYRGCRLAA